MCIKVDNPHQKIAASKFSAVFEIFLNQHPNQWNIMFIFLFDTMIYP